MKELVYADSEVYQEIKKRWPNATFEDASDFIHTERFHLEIPDAEEDDFYPFAIQYGFATCCLRFQIKLQGGKKNDLDKIKDWIERADKIQ